MLPFHLRLKCSHQEAIRTLSLSPFSFVPVQMPDVDAGKSNSILIPRDNLDAAEGAKRARSAKNPQTQ